MQISTSKQNVLRMTIAEQGGGDDGSTFVQIWYEKGEGTKVTIYFTAYMAGNTRNYTGNATLNTPWGSKGISWGRYYGDTVSFSTNYTDAGTFSVYGTVSLSSIRTYDQTGWCDVSIVSGTSSTQTFTLPSIDPVPSATIGTVSAVSGAYQGKFVAGVTVLQVPITFNYAKSATLKAEGAGVSKTYTISVTKASSETKTITLDKLTASSSNYTLKLTASFSNDTGDSSSTKDVSVVLYNPPTTSSSTSVARCDANGNPSNLGTYGKLHLVLEATPIDTNTPNTVQTAVVQLQRSSGSTKETLTPISGSVASKTLEYLFPLDVATQGNLTITLTDKLTTNIITSWIVPKAIMPFSLYQSGDSVGAAVGRMATEPGLFLYIDTYLKYGSDVYKLSIDSSGYVKGTKI